MKIAVLLLVTLAGVVGLVAQEPPAETSTPAPLTTPLVDTVAGAPVAVVPAPPAASEKVVEAVAEQAASTIRSITAGDITLAQGTRDPAETADPGSSDAFWVLSMIFGAVMVPLIAFGAEKASKIDARLGIALSGAVLFSFYGVAWAILHGSNPSLPQDLISWLGAAAGSGYIGAIVQSLTRTARGRMNGNSTGTGTTGIFNTQGGGN
jgi:hypothetical protein